MHAQRKQSLINAGYEAKSKKIKCGCRAKVKSEAGYVSKNTLVASILGHYGTNFIYFGPLDNRTWAHHAKWAQYRETSGFRKPETRREKGCPRDCFFWEILRFFPRKWFSQWPNTFILIKKIFSGQFQLNFDSIRKNDRENSFVEANEITGRSLDSHMQEVMFFLNSFFKTLCYRQ